jgi:hypothetical protein
LKIGSKWVELVKISILDGGQFTWVELRIFLGSTYAVQRGSNMARVWSRLLLLGVSAILVDFQEARVGHRLL